MSIQHALLTSLLKKPSTGYELANRFDHSMGHFWQASHQQIYRSIDQRYFSDAPTGHAQQLRHAVLRRGIMAEENWPEWATQTLA
ncbi:MAG: PadR family transcriptional regulator [Pseudomonas sp.]